MSLVRRLFTETAYKRPAQGAHTEAAAKRVQYGESERVSVRRSFTPWAGRARDQD